ncbi:hypothetical protein [Geodermatophilus sp. SYSU D01105]
MTVLVVDMANVLGSRPDGWWRDRAGATSRLLQRLAPLTGRLLPGPGGGRLVATELVAVVEGAAQQARAPDGVSLARAPGSGDDALVACVARLVREGRDVLVVTADRGLRDRLPAGVPATGPGWLWSALEDRPA